MKKLMILASMALFSACSKDVLPDNTEANDELKTITLPISTGEVDTRIAINDEASSDSWKFEWEEGESVSVWHDASCTSLSEFKMDDNGYDADMSTFSGQVSVGASQIRVISPYDANATAVTDNKYYTLDISAQDGTLNKLYMMSDELTYILGNEISGEKPNMRHLGSFVALYFELTNAESGVEYAITEVKLSGVPTTMAVDMSATEFTTHDNSLEKTGTITATLSGDTFKFTDASSTVEARLNMLPFTFAQGEKLTFDITYTAGGTEYSTQVVRENTSGADILFELAKYNYSTITIDVPLNIATAKINGWGEGNGEDGEDLSAEPFVPTSFIEFDKSMSATANITKTDDAGAIENLLAKFRRCVITSTDGGTATIKYLNNTNSTLYEDGTDAPITSNDVMVYFPEYWYKYESTGDDTFRYYFSESAVDGYVYVEASLVGAYKGYIEIDVDDADNSTLYSRSGETPTGTVTQPDVKTYAANRGTGYQIIDYEQHCTIAMMLYARYCDRNTQTYLGVGGAALSTTTGSTNSIGNADTSDETSSWVNGLGIEGVFGGISEWIDGVVVNKYVWTITNPSSDDNSTRTVTAGSSDGYITALALESGSYFDMVPTAASGGSVSTYYADSYSCSSSDSRVVYRSLYSTSTNGGVSYANASWDSSYSFMFIGSRLAFRGTIVESNQ